jgi:hypothetical protein
MPRACTLVKTGGETSVRRAVNTISQETNKRCCRIGDYSPGPRYSHAESSSFRLPPPSWTEVALSQVVDALQATVIFRCRNAPSRRIVKIGGHVSHVMPFSKLHVTWPIRKRCRSTGMLGRRAGWKESMAWRFDRWDLCGGTKSGKVDDYLIRGPSRTLPNACTRLFSRTENFVGNVLTFLPLHRTNLR